MLKFKKGDKIIIISGKYKNKKGIIEKIFKKENKVIIKNIGLIKKYFKKNKILIKKYKFDISKISIIDPKLKIKTKIGFKYINGKKYRFCKKSNIILNNNN
ncbi:MAG: 50S ribosomal protein L24 [Candidatus Shikimatogenerans sp. JK-2022]|nr:50S ribosomal protein L24 [Candidatus Shikimatogenerans bostrichidophilus]